MAAMALFRRAAKIARQTMHAPSHRIALRAAAAPVSTSITEQRAHFYTKIKSSKVDSDEYVRNILRSKGANICSIREDASVIEAVDLMVKENVGSLIVLDKDEIPVSMLTESDYLKKMPTRKPGATRVSDIMSTKSFTHVTPDSSLMETVEAMANDNICHVPVIQDNKVLGMVSVGDCVKELVALHRKNAQHIRDYICGGY